MVPSSSTHGHATSQSGLSRTNAYAGTLPVHPTQWAQFQQMLPLGQSESVHGLVAGETYLRTVAAAKEGAAGIHVHAFSPLEVWQGARLLGWPLARFLRALRDAGLGSLPGTAAEVLCDDVRAAICPDKLTSAQWLQVRCNELQGSAGRHHRGWA